MTGRIDRERAVAPAARWQGGNEAGAPDLDAVWRAAEPYLRVRKGDVHIPISFAFAERLIAEHGEADGLVVRLGILLHDIGWHSVDEDEILSKGFAGDWRKADIRFVHEAEGCRLAVELLNALGYDSAIIARVTDIIDGHDTRPEARSIDDALVRDADKLWRFTPTGIALSSGWFKKSPSQYVLQLEEKTFGELHTGTARRIARDELDNARAVLKIGLL